MPPFLPAKVKMKMLQRMVCKGRVAVVIDAFPTVKKNQPSNCIASAGHDGRWLE